jgi:hypothetical protein
VRPVTGEQPGNRVIHRPVIHRPPGRPVAAPTGGDHTDPMPNPQNPPPCTRLEAAATNVANQPSPPAVYQALALAWHTVAAVTRPASPATEHRWMRLAEALHAAWSDLAAVDPPPGPIGTGAAGPPDQDLADTAQLRRAVARLLRTTATGLRQLATSAERADPHTALTLTCAAATLQAAVQDWP